MSHHRKPSGTWYFKFRVRGQPKPITGYGYPTKEAAGAAERAARQAAQAGRIDALRAILHPAAAPTVGQLAALWADAGYAQPNRRPRTERQQQTQATFLNYALSWWKDRPSDAIPGPLLGDYAEARRRTIRTGSNGDRTIDVELGVLSNLFQWAVAVGHAKSNPFARRPKFQDSRTVDHCAAYMPESDEELHQLTGWLITVGRVSDEPGTTIAGAQLLFQALTGLRPGEPGLLRWDASQRAGRYEPGHIRQALFDGQQQEILTVGRLKRGQNPTVPVHPALRAFMDAWRPYARAHWPETPFWFPNPHNQQKPLVPAGESGRILNTPLNLAAAHLQVGERTGHAMRAYHVRVLRSQGVLDATIAARLGQSGGSRLIETTYGESTDAFGDGAFDFWPDPAGEVRPAWELLTTTPASNVIAL